MLRLLVLMVAMCLSSAAVADTKLFLVCDGNEVTLSPEILVKKDPSGELRGIPKTFSLEVSIRDASSDTVRVTAVQLSKHGQFCGQLVGFADATGLDLQCTVKKSINSLVSGHRYIMIDRIGGSFKEDQETKDPDANSSKIFGIRTLGKCTITTPLY